jgi:hypothetical protein
MKVVFRISERRDEAALRRLLKENPMPGEISIAFSREPDFFLAAGVEGGNMRVIAGEDGETLAGFGSMCVKKLYINGRPGEMGYLSGLRADKKYRGGIHLFRGLRWFRNIHPENKVPYYLTTIAEDNKPAMAILAANRPGMPVYNKRGLYLTRAINIYGKKPEIKGFNIIRGSAENFEGILECINRNGAKRQFFPYYTKEEFLQGGGPLLGLNAGDFYAVEKDGKITGACAKWDQSAFKQNIINGYSGRMSLIKPLYNAAAGIFRYNPLPPKGGELKSFYLSFMCADDNDPEILGALVRRIYNDSAGSGFHYFLAGLFEGDPLMPAFKNYIGVTYRTRFFLVCWEDGAGDIGALDDRLPYLEAATL